MDLIKRTPAERHPVIPAEFLFLAAKINTEGFGYSVEKPMLPVRVFNAILANTSATYGMNDRLTREAELQRFIMCVRFACQKELAKLETDRIENKTKEATHKIIDINGVKAHAYSGYDLPDPDDNHGGPRGAA
jgi:hypothetical protein